MLVKKVSKFLIDNNLINDKYAIVAVSGGVDSVVLLDLLLKLKVKVVLAHVNHHKRKESEMEEKALKEYALKNNIPFEKLDFFFDNVGNFHDVAHNARYDFFKSLCLKYHTNYIYTAHHADDQLETIFIKLIEGSNLYGYGGISKINDDGNYQIIRPLISISKEEIYKYAKENNLVYFEDSSNQEDHFLRNRIRHNIIPILNKESIDIYNKANEYSDIIKEAFDYIRKDSIKYLNSSNNEINLSSFSKLHIALKKDIICLLLERYEIRKNNEIINSILNLLSDNKGNKRLVLANGYVLVREYDKAYIKKDIELEDREISLNLNEVIIYDNKYKMYFSKNKPIVNAKYIKLCYNNLELPFLVRNKKDGDTINLLIGRKKVNRLFIDYKVPEDERNDVPIITNGNGVILWVYDLAKSKEVFDQKENGDIFLVVERNDVNE